MDFRRSQAAILARRLEEPRRFIQAAAGECELFYWRERNYEVDFVTKAARRLTAFEVKSGRTPDALPGMSAFSAAFKPHRKLLVGGDGIPVEEFLGRPAGHWIKD